MVHPLAPRATSPSTDAVSGCPRRQKRCQSVQDSTLSRREIQTSCPRSIRTSFQALVSCISPSSRLHTFRVSIPIFSPHLARTPNWPPRSTLSKPVIVDDSFHPFPSHPFQSSVTSTSQSTPASSAPPGVERFGSSALSYIHPGLRGCGIAGDMANGSECMNVNSDAPVWRGYVVKCIVTSYQLKRPSKTQKGLTAMVRCHLDLLQRFPYFASWVVVDTQKG